MFKLKFSVMYRPTVNRTLPSKGIEGVSKKNYIAFNFVTEKKNIVHSTKKLVHVFL